MCRLFGFRSVIQSKMHKSLVGGDQSFMHLSEDHPDGWGVAYYIASAPHVVKSESAAIKDNLFKKVSGIVASNTVIAHLRKATAGSIDITNTHPFQYGRWVFAHNGNIKAFDSYRSALLSDIPEEFKRFIIGQTDSELLFYFLIARISEHVSLHSKAIDAVALTSAVALAISEITSIIGPYKLKDGPSTETYLSFILTNGIEFLVFNGGKPLYYSTHKSVCSEKSDCAYYNQTCEAKSLIGDRINHLLVSSEPISGDNIWTALKPGELLTLDRNMRYNIVAI